MAPAELHHINHDDAGGTTESEIAWLKLLTYRQTWAFSIAKFLTDPIWWFYLFWLPSYFDSRFHLGLSRLGLPLIIVYNVSVIGSIGGGWLPALFRTLQPDVRRARISAMLVCACLVLPIFTAGTLNSEWMSIGLLSLAAAAHQGWSANLFTTASDMFPSSAVGAVVGIGGMAGSLGGVLFSGECRKDPTVDSQLQGAFRHFRRRLSDISSHSSHLGSRLEESECQRMSLCCGLSWLIRGTFLD